MHIPNIDVSELVSKPQSSWQDVVYQIDHACKNTGFFYITSHGIKSELINKVLKSAQLFFDQEAVAKSKNIRSNNPYHVGYSPIGAENLAMDAMITDLKESFDISPDLSNHNDTLYPDLNGFKIVMLDYYDKLFKISMRLLEAMALALGESRDIFTNHFIPSSGIILRLNHYPPSNRKINDIIAAAHTDYGYLTLLYQDDIGGLQIKNRSDQWIDVPYVKDSFVVNIGDLMQRLTNDIYKSTLHRVLLKNPRKSRLSIPYFVEPNYNTVIKCLSSCLLASGEPKYQPVVSGEWITAKLKKTYEITVNNS